MVEKLVPNNRLPEKKIRVLDTGVYTLRRFRYQAAFAAVYSLRLVTNNPEYEEVFCEHYEDLLVNRKDRKYYWKQVKTRENKSINYFIYL